MTAVVPGDWKASVIFFPKFKKGDPEDVANYPPSELDLCCVQGLRTNRSRSPSSLVSHPV